MNSDYSSLNPLSASLKGILILVVRWVISQRLLAFHRCGKIKLPINLYEMSPKNDLDTASFAGFSLSFPLMPPTMIPLTIHPTDHMARFAELILLVVIVKSLLSMFHSARPTVLVSFIQFNRLLALVFLLFYFSLAFVALISPTIVTSSVLNLGLSCYLFHPWDR